MDNSVYTAIFILVLYLEFSHCAYFQEQEYDFLVSKRSAGAVLTEEEAAEAVTLHNEWRRNVDPPAVNMVELVYDDDLAQLSLLWVETCEYNHPEEFKHPDFNGASTNLYWTSSRHPDIARVIEAWGEEVNIYDYQTNHCPLGKRCGHYKLMVSESVRRFGCAQKFCDILTDKDKVMKNRYLYTCTYSPKGNYQRRPYTPGPSGSECVTRTSFNGLCRECDVGTPGCECNLQCMNCGTVDRSSCTCNCPTGYSGFKCQTLCKDKNRVCKEKGFLRKKKKHCTEAKYQKACPATCGICELPTGTPTC